MSRRTYVYRLEVTLPPGSDKPGWEPEAYEEVFYERWGGDANQFDVPLFQWPARRLSFSRAAATRRAALLERYGAKVTIVRSLPVEWPEEATP